MYTIAWNGGGMPKQPPDRRRHTPSARWPTAWVAAECFPAQPPHRGTRASPMLTWVELNSLPTGNLNTH